MTCILLASFATLCAAATIVIPVLGAICQASDPALTPRINPAYRTIDPGFPPRSPEAMINRLCKTTLFR